VCFSEYIFDRVLFLFLLLSFFLSFVVDNFEYLFWIKKTTKEREKDCVISCVCHVAAVVLFSFVCACITDLQARLTNISGRWKKEKGIKGENNFPNVMGYLGKREV